MTFLSFWNYSCIDVRGLVAVLFLVQTYALKLHRRSTGPWAAHNATLKRILLFNCFSILHSRYILQWIELAVNCSFLKLYRSQ